MGEFVKVMNFCFIISYLLLATSPIFCATISILNHAKVKIKTNIPSIAEISEGGKKENQQVDNTLFSITYEKNNANYECKNIEIDDGALYTVGDDSKIYSDKNKKQWTCKKLLPKFTVKNDSGIKIAVWRGGGEFVYIDSGKTSDPLEPINTEVSSFGIHAEVNTDQKLKCNNIKIENGKKYTIKNNNGIITVDGQQDSCYFIGKVKVTNETDGILNIGSLQVGGKNTFAVFEMDEGRKNFTAVITYNLKGHELKNIPALLGVNEYTIQEDNNSYFVKAGDKIRQSVKKSK